MAALAPALRKLDVGVMRMGDRSDLVFMALMVILMVWSDHIWLALLVACVHRTLRSNQALRRELYPHLSA